MAGADSLPALADTAGIAIAAGIVVADIVVAAGIVAADIEKEAAGMMVQAHSYYVHS